MQRISAFWSTRRQSSASISTQKTADPPARRHVKEDYWPTTLDRETEKAARILHSFCSKSLPFLGERMSRPSRSGVEPQLTRLTAEGYISNSSSDDGPASPRSSLSSTQTKKKIPPRIVQNAVGLAIFSCMRSGLWKSGSGGSGILVARKSDGRWSPPSGLLLHTAALGFVIGVDVYDCVLVINSMSDLEMFTRATITLGADVELSVGPILPTGQIESDTRSKDTLQNVCTYVKAKGEHRAVNIDGSLVTERVAENHRFYGREVSVLEVLAGQVPSVEFPELRTLYEVMKSAEGRVDFDAPLLEKLALQPAPGDAIIENPSAMLSPLSPGRPAFGVPDFEDPDPFGVKALEMAGLEIREAGTKQRPPSSQFEYNPSPLSPLFGQFNHRQSSDTYVTLSNRASGMSYRTTFSRMTDAFTQTTTETRGTTPTSDDGRECASIDRLPVVVEPEEIDYTKVDDSAIRRWSQNEHLTYESKSVGNAIEVIKEEAPDQHIAAVKDAVDDSAGNESITHTVDERDEDADDEDDDSDEEVGANTLDDDDSVAEDDEDEEEPVVFEVYEAKAIQPARTAIMATQVTQITQAKGAIVNIPKRVAPPVPPRSPARSSYTGKGDLGEIPAKSPLRRSFQSGVSAPSRRSSADTTEMMGLDGVVNSTPVEFAADVTPASPAQQKAKTPEPESPKSVESEERQSGEHRRDSSAFYTSVLEHRMSSEVEDMPRTPSTLQTSGPTSSGDEQEPRTPKPEDDMAPVQDQDMSKKLTMEEARRSLGVAVDAN